MACNEPPSGGVGAGDSSSGGGIPLYPVTDQDVTDAVRTAFFLDPDLEENQFQIETVNRVVYLRGISRSADERDHAVHVATGVQGVERVICEIRIARSSQ